MSGEFLDLLPKNQANSAPIKLIPPRVMAIFNQRGWGMDAKEVVF
jgi:hypothetical protein